MKQLIRLFAIVIIMYATAPVKAATDCLYGESENGHCYCQAATACGGANQSNPDPQCNISYMNFSGTGCRDGNMAAMMDIFSQNCEINGGKTDCDADGAGGHDELNNCDYTTGNCKCKLQSCMVPTR